MKIEHTMRGHYSGQSDESLFIRDGDVIAAYLDYSVYEDTPHVQMLEVDPKYRQRGYGSALVRELQSQHPDVEIEWGMLTDDGAKLYKSLDFKTIIDPKIKNKIDLLARVKAKLKHLSDNPVGQSNDYWHRLYDMETSLEADLWGKKAERKIII